MGLGKILAIVGAGAACVITGGLAAPAIGAGLALLWVYPALRLLQPDWRLLAAEHCRRRCR